MKDYVIFHQGGALVITATSFHAAADAAREMGVVAQLIRLK